MPDELLRRGDLVLYHDAEPSERVALVRDVTDGRGEPWSRSLTLDRAEWDWVAMCAAPLALSVFGPEPDPRAGSTGSCEVVE